MRRTCKYMICLPQASRTALQGLVSRGSHPARVINRARVLLMADAGHSDPAIVEALGLCRATVANLRKAYCENTDVPILTLIEDAPRPGRPLKVDSRVETRLTAIACTDPPAGQAKWTLRLLADELVRLEVVDELSHETVRRTLKKTG